MKPTKRPATDRPARRLGGRPLRVGFVVDWLSDAYQNALLDGAREVASERGVSLVALPGGVVSAEHAHGARRNHLFGLIDPAHYDGLVLLTGTLGNARVGDVRDLVCPGFRPEKICSVAIALPGSSAVLIDNASGVSEAVTHLVTKHSAKRIGFVRGPVANAEAETRFEAYKATLAAHGIPYREELVVQGDFRREAGTEAVRILLDERKLAVSEIDALVSADDSMALAILEELRRRKIKTPADIAVVGFDDVEEAKYSNPPLTSVRQPLREQGRRAMQALLSVLSHGVSPETLTLETSCSFRRSCGCLPEDEHHLTEGPQASRVMDLEASLIARRELVLAEMSRSARGAFSGPGRGWEVRLFNALQDEFRGQRGSFRSAFDLLLEQVLATEGDVSAGNALISALRKQLTLSAANNPEHLRRIESLLHEARSLTSNIVERAEAQNRISVQRQARRLTDASTEMLSASGAQALAHSMAEELPRLSIHAASVCAYTPNDRSRAQHIAGFGRFGVAYKTDDSAPFVASQLLPEALDSGQTQQFLVVLPLQRGDEPLGFAVLEMAQVEGYVYEVLGRVFATALHLALSFHSSRRSTYIDTGMTSG